MPPAAVASQGLLAPPVARRTPLDELTPDGRPTAAAIAMLRARAGHGVVRLSIGGRRLLVQHVRFDSLGVAFDPEPPRNARGSGARDSAGVPPVGSPVPWSAIGELETRHSHAYTGIAVGTLLMLVACEAVIGTGPEAGPANIVIGLSLPPAGAVIGGLIGARRPRWRHEWPPAARATAPGR